MGAGSSGKIHALGLKGPGFESCLDFGFFWAENYSHMCFNLHRCINGYLLGHKAMCCDCDLCHLYTADLQLIDHDQGNILVKLF